jgi:hypothetical protein
MKLGAFLSFLSVETMLDNILALRVEASDYQCTACVGHVAAKHPD